MRRATRRFRHSVSLAGLVLVLSFLHPAAASAAVDASAAVECPELTFFGVHGVNENGPDVPDDEFGGVGETVWNVWKAFEANAAIPQTKGFEAVDYPKFRVDLFEVDWLDGLEDDAASAALLAAELALLDTGANMAADALVSQLHATYEKCGDGTDYVIVGFSQGAWAIDKALRSGLPFTRIAPHVEAQIIGILVLGDPAGPVLPDGQRQGMARAAAQLGLLPGWDISDPFVPTRFENRFLWVCAVGADIADPICGYDGNPLSIAPSLSWHSVYKDHSTLWAEQLRIWVEASEA